MQLQYSLTASKASAAVVWKQFNSFVRPSLGAETTQLFCYEFYRPLRENND